MLKPFDSPKFAEDFNRVTREGCIKTLRALFQEDQSIPKKEFLNRIATFFKENEIGVPSFVVPKIIDGFVSGMLHNGLLREEKDNYTIC